MRSRRWGRLAGGLLGIAACVPAASDAGSTDSGSLCPRPAVEERALPPLESTPVDIEAGAIRGDLTRGVLELLEGVRIDSGPRSIRAPRIRLERSADTEGRLTFPEGVRYADPLQAFRGASGFLDLETDRGELEDVAFRLLTRRARGSAERIERQGPDRLTIRAGTYTTCPPDDPAWHLKAGRIRIDRAREVGVLRDATLHFFGVPIAYWPYWDFPLAGQRKSGFLVPGFANSERRGVELEVPYYWNIAPTLDATLTARVMARRGSGFDTELRYLRRRHAGELALDVLPRDDLTGEPRSRLRLGHRAALGHGWHWSADVHAVSDRRYLNDLGRSVQATSRSYLEQRAELAYQGNRQEATIRYQGFQPLLDRDRTFRRQPAAQWTGYSDVGPFELTGAVEWARFAHRDAPGVRRFDMTPALTAPTRTGPLRLEPRLAWRYTHYTGEAVAGHAGSDERAIPVLSVDARLAFRQPLPDGRLQTLEPHAYYLYVPFRAQDRLPVLDTGVQDLRFPRLFSPNRFTGPDRIGDAHRLSLGLTSRLLETDTGVETLRASLGQVVHFRDRQVTLPDGSGSERGVSDILAEVIGRLTRRLEARSVIRWDTEANQFGEAVVETTLKPDADRGLRLGYRFRNDEQHQLDTGLFWSITPHWRLIGRWQYSLRADKTLEARAGLSYRSCCWALRVGGRRFLLDGGEDAETALSLRLELTGLGGLGLETDALSRDAILGPLAD